MKVGEVIAIQVWNSVQEKISLLGLSERKYFALFPWAYHYESVQFLWRVKKVNPANQS